MPLHNAFIGLQLFSMYMVATKCLKENLERIFNRIIRPFFDFVNYNEQPYVGFHVEVVSLSVRLLQSFEKAMTPYSSEILGFLSKLFGKYSELYKQKDQTLDLSLHFEIIRQSSIFISLLSQVDKTLLSQKATEVFLSCSELFLLIDDINWRYELMDIIGQFLLLSTSKIRETNDNNYDDDDDLDESESEETDEEENFETSTFLIPNLNKENDEIVYEYYWKLDKEKISFDLLSKITERASLMIEEGQLDNENVMLKDVSHISTFLTTLCSSTALYFDSSQNEYIVKNSVNSMMAYIKKSSFNQTINVFLKSLKLIIKQSKVEAIRSIYKNIYSSLEDIMNNLKEWMTQNPTKKNKKLYFSIREVIIKTFTSLLMKDSLSTWDNCDHFVNTTVKLFSDPLIISTFIKSSVSVKNQDNEGKLKNDILPMFISQFLSEFKRPKVSSQVKVLIIKSVGEIAYSAGNLFEEYAIDFLKLILPLLKQHPFKYCVVILDAVAMTISSMSDVSKLDTLLGEYIKVVLDIISGKYENMDVDEDEEIGYDNYGSFIYLSEVFLLYLFKNDKVKALIKRDNNSVKSIQKTLKQLMSTELLYYEEDDIKDICEDLLNLI